MSACSLPVKVGYTNADALFSLFCKLQKSGPTFIAARSHEAGRGESETQVGSGYGQVPRTALCSQLQTPCVAPLRMVRTCTLCFYLDGDKKKRRKQVQSCFVHAYCCAKCNQSFWAGRAAAVRLRAPVDWCSLLQLYVAAAGRQAQEQVKHRAITPCVPLHTQRRVVQGHPEPEATIWALHFKKKKKRNPKHVLAIISDY